MGGAHAPGDPPPGSYAYDNLPWFYQFTTLYMQITKSVRMGHMAMPQSGPLSI